ncbi:MAG: OmpH family outer membrane protein [Candidatus Kapabacteria bacterium]|nr:OmpH family outer membrane protein [Candidatus Kapabacteria bacterium]
MLNFIVGTVLFLFVATTSLFSQKVGYFSSKGVLERLPESAQIEQQIRSTWEEWERELDLKKKEIQELEIEIRNNRLIWSDAERIEKDKELVRKKEERDAFAKIKFSPSGEVDKLPTTLYKPLIEKVYAAVQKVSNSKGFDLIFDKSTHQMAYVNPKFDITIFILEELGVDVSEDLDKLKKAIEADPRNQRIEPKQAPQKKSRSRSSKSKDTEIE